MAPFGGVTSILAAIAHDVSEVATGGRRPHTGHDVATAMEGCGNGTCTESSTSARTHSTQH